MHLTRDGCLQRRAALIERTEADLIIISNPRHIQYFCGLYVTPLALSGWGPNYLLIDTSGGDSTLLSHNFIAAEAQDAHVADLVTWEWYDAATDAGVNLWRQAVEELNKFLKPYHGRRTGIELGTMPFGAGLEDWVDVSHSILDMRRRKYPDEIALIRAAVRAVEAGHQAARAMIAPGVSELDVYNAIQAAIIQAAGQPILPLGDYASGARTAGGGGPPGPKVLADGDLMILDIFPIVGGYRADFTATLAAGGRLTREQEELQNALHHALSVGEAQLQPGNRAAEVYQAVRRALAEHGLAHRFSHHAGHGLGLDHPEAPYFVPNSGEILTVGDVVTLEPGAYGPEFGARIEHNYLITAGGFERLTNHETQF
jgi:Xaa-Pro aminopeptidase